MINKQELLFVVDEFDSPLKPLPRHHVFKKGLWRRTVHVWIINDKNEVLCQRRSLKKDMSPGKWEPYAGGHVGPEDENYFIGAVRELFEETGLKVNPEDLSLVKIYKEERYREYRGIFIYKWNGKITEIEMEEDEVEEVQFIKIETLKKYFKEESEANWCLPGYEEEIFNHII